MCTRNFHVRITAVEYSFGIMYPSLEHIDILQRGKSCIMNFCFSSHQKQGLACDRHALGPIRQRL
jgi:ribosomal protein L19